MYTSTYLDKTRRPTKKMRSGKIVFVYICVLYIPLWKCRKPICLENSKMCLGLTLQNAHTNQSVQLKAWYWERERMIPNQAADAARAGHMLIYVGVESWDGPKNPKIGTCNAKTVVLRMKVLIRCFRMFLAPFQHLQCLSFWIKDLKAELKQPGHPKRLKLLDLFPGSSADLVAFFRCPVSNPMLQTAIDANSFDQTENIQFLERLSRHHSV